MKEIDVIVKHLDGAQRATDALALLLNKAGPTDLLGSAEVADLLGWNRSSVSAHLARGRLPTPYARLRCGPIWTRAQIEEWIAGRTAAAAS